jgi:hypothetical protein
MISTGIGNDSSLALFGREGSDFVIRSAQFEGADRLLVFGLQKEAARIVDG